MADIDNKTRKFAANNPQVTLQEGRKISFNSQNKIIYKKIIFLQFAERTKNAFKFRISNVTVKMPPKRNQKRRNTENAPRKKNVKNEKNVKEKRRLQKIHKNLASHVSLIS